MQKISGGWLGGGSPESDYRVCLHPLCVFFFFWGGGGTPDGTQSSTISNVGRARLTCFDL